MAAKKGNTYTEKFKTPEARQDLCKKWCAHLMAGYTRESFPYCDPQTFRRYLEKYPNDFDKNAIEAAERMQKMAWEAMLMSCAKGGRGNAASIIFGLKNINGWKDRQEIGLDKDTRAVFRMRMGKELSPTTPDEEE